MFNFRKEKQEQTNQVQQEIAHRQKVGGLWDEMGTLQFDFMIRNGLKPHHKLLDIGCGSLRGGVHFINYLESGNYYGIDQDEQLLNAARQEELPHYNLADKAITLICRDDFNFSKFGIDFDYVIAQSVFTHLSWNSILRCLANLSQVLSKEGKFFATFFENNNSKYYIEALQHEPGGIITHSDRDPYHYDFEAFRELADKVSLKVEYIGSWNHPRAQKMMLFTKHGS